jgi:hypothetical protein
MNLRLQGVKLVGRQANCVHLDPLRVHQTLKAYRNSSAYRYGRVMAPVTPSNVSGQQETNTHISHTELHLVLILYGHSTWHFTVGKNTTPIESALKQSAWLFWNLSG